MKAFLVNIIFIVFWTIVGHFVPIINIGFVFIAFPLLFILTHIFIKYKYSIYLIVPFCFLMILLNDYLFRIFGGGIHDDAGRGWCELIFYITLFTSTITILFIVFTITESQNKKSKMQWLYNIILVVGNAIATYLVFMKFNVKI